MGQKHLMRLRIKLGLKFRKKREKEEKEEKGEKKDVLFVEDLRICHFENIYV